MSKFEIGDHVLVTDPLIDLHRHPAIVHGYTPNSKYPYWVEIVDPSNPYKRLIVATEEQITQQ